LRQFDSGATRDSDDDKLAYEAFLSPVALERYARYMHAHRIQPDGTLRDGDNWQRGIPIETYQDSLVRHLFQAWGAWRGTGVTDEKGRPVEVEEALCAILFNAFGLLHEMGKQQPGHSEGPF
jgi:hypothetical protein